jgi:hypothetical protein
VRISWKDVFKFLAGAAFVNAGVLFYFYLTNTAVPVLGTHFVMEPETNGLRSLVHFLFFLVLLLFRLYPPVTSSFTGLARCGWRGWCIRAELPPPQTIQPSSRDFLKSTPSNQHLGLSRKEKAPASSAGLLLTQVTGRSHAMLGDWVGIWGAHDAT